MNRMAMFLSVACCALWIARIFPWQAETGTAKVLGGGNGGWMVERVWYLEDSWQMKDSSWNLATQTQKPLFLLGKAKQFAVSNMEYPNFHLFFSVSAGEFVKSWGPQEGRNDEIWNRSSKLKNWIAGGIGHLLERESIHWEGDEGGP